MGKGFGKGGCGCTTDEKDLKPDHPRYCQDLLWAALFIAFCIGIFVVMGVAFDEGEPERILYGYDSYGNICGRSNPKRIDVPNSGLDMSGRDSVYILPSGLVLCVPECPETDSTLSFDPAGIIYCDFDTANLNACKEAQICLSNSSVYNFVGNETGVNSNGCPEYAYKSEEIPVLNRCLPKVVTDVVGGSVDAAEKVLNEYAKFQNAQAELQGFAQSFVNAYEIMVTLAVLSAIGSFTLVALMRCCAGPIIYLIIFICSVALLAATGILSYIVAKRADEYYDDPPDQRLESDERDLYIFIGLLVFVALFALIFICIICGLRKKIYSAVQIFEEASKALFQMPTVFCVPVCSLVSIVIWLVVWGLTMVYAATANDHAIDSNGWIEYKISERQEVMFVYLVFALYWLIQLFLAMEEFIIASCIVIWYLHEQKYKGFVVVKSVWRLFRYHFGSLCQGSFIVALVQFARAIVDYVEYKTKEAGQESCIIKYFFCCLRCLLYCLQKCVQFINKNAYIEIAIWGDSFCVSACHALSILTSNLGLIASVNGVGFLLAFTIKVTVVASVGFIAFLWLDEEEDVEDAAAISIFCMLFAYVIADAFTDVYDMAAESLTICFLEDYKHNSDVGMLAPEDLKKLMAKSDKTLENQIGRKKSDQNHSV
eukprot:m.338736 g.338736  ORF g.338736 m.338736 type:complete len:655 (-) comp18530_c0_seq1:71-2035(-)